MVFKKDVNIMNRMDKKTCINSIITSISIIAFAGLLINIANMITIFAPFENKMLINLVLYLIACVFGFAVLPYGGDPIAVLTDDILYMKGEGSYTRIYVRQSGSVQGILISKTLGTMEKELEKLPFIRVHKSYIVNVTKIRYLNTEVHLLECETRIPVGRFYKNVVKETYFEYGKRMISRK